MFLVLGAVVALRMRRRLADTRAWRWYFLIEAIGALVYATHEALGVVSSGVYIPSIYLAYWLFTYARILLGGIGWLVLMIAALADRRADRRRHWTHWAMVAASLTVGAGWIATYVGWLYYSDWYYR